MKKQLLSVASILLATFTFGQTIPNGSFEDWSSEELYEEPDAEGVILSTSNTENYSRYEALTLSKGEGDSTLYLENIVVEDEGQEITLTSFIVWGEPGDDTPFPGGFTVGDTPTTLDVSVRFKADTSSPSFFLVQFVKADTAMSFEVFPLAGDSSGGFVTYSWDLESLPAIPDLAVVGFAVNNLVDDGESIAGDFMEVDYIRFDDEYGSIPGGEFSDWKMKYEYPEPDGWTVYNAQNIEPLVSESDMSTDGVSSISVKTIAYEDDTLASLAFIGEYDEAEDRIKPVFTFTTSGEYVFSFDYKYNQAGIDSGSVLFAVTRSIANVSVPIAFGDYSIESTPDFKTWVSPSFIAVAGDSVVVALAASDIFNDDIYEIKVPGSELWVDNMTFDIVTGLNPDNSSEAFTVYPNPSSGVFKYNFSDVENIERVRVVDAAGTVVYESTSFGQFDTKIDLSNEPNGVYNLVIDSSNGTTSRKMMKQ